MSKIADRIALFENFKEELGDDVSEIVTAFENCFGAAESAEQVRDAYRGKYNSERDYAVQLVYDLGYMDQMPDYLGLYFDYDAFARDVFITDYVMDNGHVFNRDW